MTPEEAFEKWLKDKYPSTVFADAIDTGHYQMAKQAWLEATRQAYEDAARITDKYHGSAAKAIRAKAKELDNETP